MQCTRTLDCSTYGANCGCTACDGGKDPDSSGSQCVSCLAAAAAHAGPPEWVSGLTSQKGLCSVHTATLPALPWRWPSNWVQCTTITGCSTYDASCKCTACNQGQTPATGGGKCVSAVRLAMLSCADGTLRTIESRSARQLRLVRDGWAGWTEQSKQAAPRLLQTRPLAV